MFRFLITLGHRHIAHIRGGTKAAAAECLESYLQVMLENDLPPLVFEGGSDADAGRRGVDALVAHSPVPTAIFAYNDLLSCGAVNRLHGLGKRVPEDISVVGFDDIPAAASETLSITTLRQDREDQARKAVSALLVLMREGDSQAQIIVVPVELMVRRPVSAPRKPFR
ncbi:substrate-binding domain-containing protein [Pseudomonas abietaniphila]|uniref:substrate-binding domain-containing protein n=1 Tax=Pseudomonas abietaniphila TaxID=89065 RepID=UPI003D36ABE0